MKTEKMNIEQTMRPITKRPTSTNGVSSETAEPGTDQPPVVGDDTAMAGKVEEDGTDGTSQR